jgi:hypothetical protein
MAKPKLSLAQQEELKSFVLQGVAPQDIADHFGVAISSVHNYKKQLRQEGVDLPSVKGQRPTGNFNPGGATQTPQGAVQPQSTVPSSAGSAGNPSAAQPTAENMTFIVNGSTIRIEGHAKDVVIANGQIKVQF